MKLSELITSRLTGLNHVVRPYLIAEAGGNHEGDMDLATRLLDEAREGWAQEIKFQSYAAETITANSSP